MSNNVKAQLDPEWVELILEALDMGISVEDIKSFFIEKELEQRNIV
jgi:hypothetical protein